MINANEAKANVINYVAAQNAILEEKISSLLDTMSKSIDYHSKHGFSSLQFCPYEKSRFTSEQSLKYAQARFKEIFEKEGYTIIKNNYEENMLHIAW